MVLLWLYSRHCQYCRKIIHGWEVFVTKLRVIFVVLPMMLLCFFAILSEIRYAKNNISGWS